MRALGRRLAGLLRAGDLVVLAGSLGAGKTTLTQGVGLGLGVRGPVTSPTFVIARVHPGRCRWCTSTPTGSDHWPVADLDLETSLSDSVTVVEWGTGLVEEPRRRPPRGHAHAPVRRRDAHRQRPRSAPAGYRSRPRPPHASH